MITLFRKHFDSGPDYLKRVCSEQDGNDAIKIMTVSEVKAYMLEDKEVNTWMAGVKEYLTEINGQIINDRKLVFFIESQMFLTNTDPKRTTSVMVR